MKKSYGSVVALLGAVVVGLAWWSWADLYSTALGNFVQGNAYWLAWALPVLVTGSVAASLYNAADGARRSSRDSYGSRSSDVVSAGRTRANVAVTVAVLVTIVSVIGLVYTVVTHGYNVKRAYIGSVEVVEKDAPEFSERAAYQVAAAQAAGNLGEVRGEIVDTDYVADEDVFTSIVERPGFFQGYAAVQSQTVALTGQATAKNCVFSAAASARLGGNFTHSLERQISHVKRGLIIDDSDAYGYCDGETPLVVVPVKNHKGWFPAIEVPAGVAVYNGETGLVEYLPSVDSGELSGPVFPVSLAAELRESTAAMGGFWDYKRDRVGFADTSRDESDPNGSNRSEFALATAQGNAPAYLTPLTLRGRSTAIAALGMVDASSVTAGEMNTYQVFDFAGERKANSAVADRLKSDYGDLPDWAAGMSIFEIAPVGGEDNTWVASLGREQNVSYRVRIKASGDSCLETAEGQQIRCGKVTATNGNGPGVALAPGSGTGTLVLPDSPEALKNMSDEEFAQLQRQIADEVARRLTTKK